MRLEDEYLDSILGPQIQEDFDDFVLRNYDNDPENVPDRPALREWSQEPVFQLRIRDRLR